MTHLRISIPIGKPVTDSPFPIINFFIVKLININESWKSCGVVPKTVIGEEKHVSYVYIYVISIIYSGWGLAFL